jgi:hypothetical protein
MRDLLLEIRISRGEPWRNIANSVWPTGGSLILGHPTAHLPLGLITATAKLRGVPVLSRDNSNRLSTIQTIS